MGINITLAYFVVGRIKPSSKQNKLILCVKSFLFILRLDGLNIVSSERCDPNNNKDNTQQKQQNKIC